MPFEPSAFALVVDDDPEFLIAMKLMMRMCGFSHIVAATNGAEAIEHLKEWRFDIILSDWNMTPMDGLDLLRALRAMPGVGNTPFVLLTASLSETA